MTNAKIKPQRKTTQSHKNEKSWNGITDDLVRTPCLHLNNDH